MGISIVSWTPEVIADRTGQWVGNGLRFATKQEALDNVRDLSYRWMAVRETRVVESIKPANYTYIGGQLLSLTPGRCEGCNK